MPEPVITIILVVLGLIFVIILLRFLVKLGIKALSCGCITILIAVGVFFLLRYLEII